MQISENGTVVSSSFYEAVIKSQARLTYSQVNDFHEEKDNASIPTKIKPVLHDLFAMYGPTVHYHSVDSCFCKDCISIAKN